MKYVQSINLNRDLALGLYDEQNTLVGFAHGAAYSEGGWPVTELGISVESGLQSSGCGTRLLDAIMELARKQGSTKLIVNTLTRNQAMKRILQKKGGQALISGSELVAEFSLGDLDDSHQMEHSYLDGMEVIRKTVHPESRTVFLLHGAGGDAWQWRLHMMPALARKGYNSVALSLPNHGRSAVRPGYVFSDYLRVVSQCYHQSDRKSILVGHSAGGFLTQHYLAQSQSEVPTLLVSSIPPFNFVDLDSGFLHSVSEQLQCHQARDHLSHLIGKARPVETEKVVAPLVFVGGRYDRVVPESWQRKAAHHYRAPYHSLSGGHNLMVGSTSKEVTDLICA